VAKKRKNKMNIRSSNDLGDVLKNFDDRIQHIEHFIGFQTKLLNANILRISAIIDILIENKLLTNEDITKKSEEIMDEIKKQAKDLKKIDDINELSDLLNSNDVGHA